MISSGAGNSGGWWRQAMSKMKARNGCKVPVSFLTSVANNYKGDYAIWADLTRTSYLEFTCAGMNSSKFPPSPA